MIEKVISGGQTGADQAALRSARSAGIVTGGTAPKGWETEDGPAPWLADFGLVECPFPGYPPRTRFNVRDSDATVYFGDESSRGAVATWRAFAEKVGDDQRTAPPLYRAGGWVAIRREGLPHHCRPEQLAKLIGDRGWSVLNCAGNRESSARGIGAWVEAYLAEVFRLLAEVPRG